MFIAISSVALGFERSYARISTEFCRKGALIGVIDGKSNTFLQSSCECLAAFQLFGADTGLVRSLLGGVGSSTE
jgi:hypothetical protein